MPVIQPNLTNIKGKRKAAVYEEGPGGTAGIVLPLQMISTAAYQTYVVKYFVPSSLPHAELSPGNIPSLFLLVAVSKTCPCKSIPALLIW